MKNENKRDSQCRNNKDQKNLEIAKEFDVKKDLSNKKDCNKDCNR